MEIHFVEINQAPSLYSMLQHTGRVATTKLVPRNCLRYSKTTLIMEGAGIGLRIYIRYYVEISTRDKKSPYN